MLPASLKLARAAIEKQDFNEGDRILAEINQRYDLLTPDSQSLFRAIQIELRSWR